MAKATGERCPWCGNDPLYVAYHDEQWGVPVHDERDLFGKLILDGAQAGLSWITILRKRDGYHRAFAEFDPERIARFNERDVARLMTDPGIVRNRLKIQSAIRNARAYLKLRDERGGLDPYLWSFVDGRPIQNRFRAMKDIPAKTPLSDTISKDLKKRGFSFVGSTIVYAYMQAIGLTNDHLVTCPRHPACAAAATKRSG